MLVVPFFNFVLFCRKLSGLYLFIYGYSDINLVKGFLIYSVGIVEFPDNGLFYYQIVES